MNKKDNKMKKLIDLFTYQPIDLNNKSVKNLLPYSLNSLLPNKKKAAFTLAEVLITLGIIGVVAALTIPSLINYFKVKQLEVQFKKADSIITQALKKTADEAGYDSISDFNIPGRKVTSENYAQLQKQVEELNEIWLRQFTSITPVSNTLISRKNLKCTGLVGTTVMFPNCWISMGPSYQLQDGLTVTGLAAQNGGANHPGLITFMFDTNGPFNGPNRWGYDIFRVYSDLNYDKSLCNPTIQNSGNQFGCYYWAKNNINPKDKSTPYWNILYKPLSYWQK